MAPIFGPRASTVSKVDTIAVLHRSSAYLLSQARVPRTGVPVNVCVMKLMLYQGLKPQYFRLQWLVDHVLGVSFNRPPVNAFHVPMWTEMHRIFSHLRGDGEVRAVVLYGEGKCFTGGLDCAYTLLTQCAILY